MYVFFGLFFSFLSRFEFLSLRMNFLFDWDVGFPLYLFVYLNVWYIEFFWNLIDFGSKKNDEKL